MTLRAFGPYNGTLPVPTGVMIAYLRNPALMPYLRYSQFIPAPAINFSYDRLNPDDAVRLVDVNEPAWAYDDYSPEGRGFNPQIEILTSRIARWAFPWTIGEETTQTWSRQNGVNPMQILDRIQMNRANLHRAVRVVTALSGASWGANTGTPATLLSTPGAFWDLSSGTQRLGGAPDPNFQVIKRSCLAVKRLLNLGTNGALSGEEMVMVVPPVVALQMAVSGEMFEALKQSVYAKDLTNPVVRDWGLLPEYGGFKVVVEDTPRCFINQHADGTVADVTVAAQKDYIMNTDTVYFVSRPGGLDSDFGGRNFSTVQIYTKNGEAQVKGKQDAWNELFQGRITTEDSVLVPSVISGYAMTDVLST